LRWQFWLSIHRLFQDPLLLTSLAPERRGTLLAVTAYLIWGFAALYWVQTAPVDSRDLLAHRALWSLPVVVLVLALSGGLRSALSLLCRPKAMLIMACAALLSATNWGIFLWAVTHEHATDASMGYFLLPLLNVLIGLTLFREKIVLVQKIAVALAVAGVASQVIYFGGLPLVSLGLAMSFGLYGAVRKAVSIGSVEGLFVEVLLMSPFALGWLIYRDGGGLGLHGLEVDLFLLGAGLVTAVPLMSYVAASRLLPLTALSLVFYIGPSAQLLVATQVFGEPFMSIHLLSFGLVWVGLALTSATSLRRFLRQRRTAPTLD
jgi:chloramphenicol-sensitive protein RarD